MLYTTRRYIISYIRKTKNIDTLYFNVPKIVVIDVFGKVKLRIISVHTMSINTSFNL